MQAPISRCISHGIFKKALAAPPSHYPGLFATRALATKIQSSNQSADSSVDCADISRSETSFTDLPPDLLFTLPSVPEQTLTPEKTSPQTPPQTFHGRPLPSELISLTSAEGKRLFRDAMDQGSCEGFFPLTGNFTTQSEPAYCGPSSLAMVLNALHVDPKRTWKGVWRWYSDELLHSCSPTELVKQHGVTFDQFTCLARCHCNVVVRRAASHPFSTFIADLERVTSDPGSHMVVSFSRSVLGQTGDGHFSPVGAFNSREGKVLILDTARYKYPSYFVDAQKLHQSMLGIDKVTGRPRGWFILSYDELRPPVPLCNISKGTNGISAVGEKPSLNWTALARTICHTLPAVLNASKPQTFERFLTTILPHFPREFPFLLDSREHTHIENIIEETTISPLHSLVLRSLGLDKNLDSSSTAFATLFILASPPSLYVGLPRAVEDELGKYRTGVSDKVSREIERIEEKIQELVRDFCSCGSEGHCEEI